MSSNALDNHLHSISTQRYSMFEIQDIKKGHFDITFQFEDKQLYCHSFILWPISKVFETMLFGEWSKNKDEPIKISTNTYEDFKEFLKFFYLGECELTLENISIIVDLAEAYDVAKLKDYCDIFLVTKAVNMQNALKSFELSKRYGLPITTTQIVIFIAENTDDIFCHKGFVELPKECVIDIAKFPYLCTTNEKLFNAILKWAKHQLFKNGITNASTKEYKLALKTILTDILPFIQFSAMKIEYLSRVLVPIGYLFSYDTLSKILLTSINSTRDETVETTETILSSVSSNSGSSKFGNRKTPFTKKKQGNFFHVLGLG